MKIETEKELKIICDTLKKVHPNKDIDFYKMGFAVEVLRLMVDNEWVNQSIFNQHKTRGKKNLDAYNFFRSDTNGYQWQERIFRFAERIFNLRNVKNFDSIIKDIISGELVSRFAEIETGRHLMSRGFDFEYNAPTGKKGKDFDIKVISEIIINCEVKHKIESTTLSAKTIKKALSAANKQLPHDTHAFIFLRIPTEWINDLSFREKIESASGEFFQRNKGHILGIVLRWEQEDLIKKGMFHWFYNVVVNKYFNHNKITSNILSKITESASKSTWLDFHDFIIENMKNK